MSTSPAMPTPQPPLQRRDVVRAGLVVHGHAPTRRAGHQPAHKPLRPQLAPTNPGATGSATLGLVYRRSEIPFGGRTTRYRRSPISPSPRERTRQLPRCRHLNLRLASGPTPGDCPWTDVWSPASLEPHSCIRTSDLSGSFHSIYFPPSRRARPYNGSGAPRLDRMGLAPKSNYGVPSPRPPLHISPWGIYPLN